MEFLCLIWITVTQINSLKGIYGILVPCKYLFSSLYTKVLYYFGSFVGTFEWPLRVIISYFDNDMMKYFLYMLEIK